MQGTERGRGEHQAASAKPVGEQDVFSNQEGVAASLQAWLAALHLLFKAPVLCDHRNSKSIQAQKFLIAFLGKPCLKLLANAIHTTEMTPHMPV